jgi:hypothetical protein
MITKRQYGEYLASTPINYTASNFAKHLEGVSHDAVTDYLRRDRLTARQVWELARQLIKASPQAYLIADDSVQAKRYSRHIELVKAQSSGNEQDGVRGIGLVKLVHSDGEAYDPIDDRIYAPDTDGKTQNDHFREMRLNAIHEQQLQAETILFDSWDASEANLKLIHRLNKTFVTRLKSNRLLSLEPKRWIHLTDIEWSELDLQKGIMVKLKKVPFKVR